MNKKTKETVIDKETGEILSITETITESTSVDVFIQIYLEDLSRYYCLSSELEIKVLTLIWKESFPYQSGERGNVIIIVKSIKERWAEKIGCKIHSIENIISKFVQNSLIFKGATATYYLNPELFFKGKLGNRTKAVNVLHKYKIIQEKEEETK